MTVVSYWYFHNLTKYYVKAIEKEGNFVSYENYLENVLFSDEVPIKRHGGRYLCKSLGDVLTPNDSTLKTASQIY